MYSCQGVGGATSYLHCLLVLLSRHMTVLNMIVSMQAWSTVRGKGKHIPSGGTLVIGREQDCPGGCFDSHPGAAGQTQRRYMANPLGLLPWPNLLVARSK